MAGWLPNQGKHCEATSLTWNEFQPAYDFYSLPLKTTTIKNWKKYRKKLLEKLGIILVKRKPRCILVSEKWCMNCICAFECCPLIIFEMSLLTEESYMWPVGKLSFQAYQQFVQNKVYHPEIFPFCIHNTLCPGRCLGLAELWVRENALECTGSCPGEITFIYGPWHIGAW